MALTGLLPNADVVLAYMSLRFFSILFSALSSVLSGYDLIRKYFIAFSFRFDPIEKDVVIDCC